MLCRYSYNNVAVLVSEQCECHFSKLRSREMDGLNRRRKSYFSEGVHSNEGEAIAEEQLHSISKGHNLVLEGQFRLNAPTPEHELLPIPNPKRPVVIFAIPGLGGVRPLDYQIEQFRVVPNVIILGVEN